MTATTIKVSSELRDRLKAQASQHARTIGEHLEPLLAEKARRERFRDLRARMAAAPPDREYVDDSEEWQSDTWM